MGIDARHPDYAKRRLDWDVMRHTHSGSMAVKDQGESYLPKPSGFTAQSDNGVAMYNAYRIRARFPDIVKPTIRGMVGIIHLREAKIEMPTRMEYLWEKATPDGLALEALHRRITMELLMQGRYGLMADVAAAGGDPYIVGYAAETIINWSENRDLFVLDESGYVRSEGSYDWVQNEKFRALKLVNGRYEVEVYDKRDVREAEEKKKNITTPQNVAQDVPESHFAPNPARGDAFEEIPFVIIGATDLAVEPEEPPLLGVAESALAIYRLDADYRHQLFWSGQETGIFTNVAKEDLPSVLGSGVYLALPENATGSYMSPSCSGIEAHERAIAAEREAAVASGSRVFDNTQKGGVESGDALRIRAAANTATLTSIAQTSAQGLEKTLRFVGRFLGMSPAEIEKIVVTPNLSFLDTIMTPQDGMALVQMWQANGMTWEDLHENLQRGGLVSAERTADEAKAMIEADPQGEPPVVPGGPGDVEDAA